MAKPPVILISASTEKKGVEFSDVSTSLSERYDRSVMAAGGLPFILSCASDRQLIAEAVRHGDGVLLTGGDDVNPRLYTHRLSARLAATTGPHDPPRDLREMLLLEEVFRQRKPLLAICRGHQLLNVALGGTLVVDIATQVPGAIHHDRSDKKSAIVHEVQLTPDSLLAKITRSTRMGVNSSHHQSVARLARGLRVTGRSHDGVVEAMELQPEATGWLPFLLAVQYHPERLVDRHEEHLDLFRAFTRVCAGLANKRL